MTIRKMRAVAIVAVTLALNGCYLSHEPGGTPGGPTTDAPDHLYVMSLIEGAEEDSAGVAPGFDLDGRVSDGSDPEGCMQMDYVGPPPERTRGIDNQVVVLQPVVAAAAGVDFDLLSKQAIASGFLTILVQLRGVDDFSDDDSVEVVLRHGEPSGGTLELDAEGRLLPGQAFRFDRGSTQTLTGSIVSGRLHAQADLLRVELPVGVERTLALPMDRGNLRFTVSPSRLSMGVGGGSMHIEPLLDALVSSIDGFPPDLVRSVLQSVADLDPDRAGRCDSVSMAFRLEAVTATRVE